MLPALHPPLYSTRTSCRACDGRFDPLLDLGPLVLSDFLAPDAPDPPAAPLDLVVCQHCDLVQLRHVVDNDRLYRRYWYQSGVNESMVAELADIVKHASSLVTLERKDTVLDIGANDGTLLSQYMTLASPLPRRYAVEPSLSFFERLSSHADCVITNYFPCLETFGIPSGTVKIATSIAMFYDLDDPAKFVEEIDRLLAPDGVWIVQMQDLAQMIAATGYDNVCFEHRCYYSTYSFSKLLIGTNLYIDQVETRAINGGSLRYTLRRAKYLATDSGKRADAQCNRETPFVSREALDHFAWRVGEHRDQLRGLLTYHLERGDPIDLYAASTKSSTLLQHCGLDRTWIRQAAERLPSKWGLVTSGTRIPIVSEEEWRADPAPITVVGAWGFRESFLQREAEYLAKGGRFIFPLPSLEVVSGRR